MLLFDETKITQLENLLKFPLLFFSLWLSYQSFPFLYYTFGGANTAKAGLIAWLISAGVSVWIHFWFDEEVSMHIKHAFPRIGARMLLLALSIPLGCLISIMWALVLLAGVVITVVFEVMKVIK